MNFLCPKYEPKHIQPSIFPGVGVVERRVAAMPPNKHLSSHTTTRKPSAMFPHKVKFCCPVNRFSILSNSKMDGQTSNFSILFYGNQWQIWGGKCLHGGHNSAKNHKALYEALAEKKHISFLFCGFCCSAFWKIENCGEWWWGNRRNKRGFLVCSVVFFVATSLNNTHDVLLRFVNVRVGWESYFSTNSLGQFLAGSLVAPGRVVIFTHNHGE